MKKRSFIRKLSCRGRCTTVVVDTTTTMMKCAAAFIFVIASLQSNNNAVVSAFSPLLTPGYASFESMSTATTKTTVTTSLCGVRSAIKRGFFKMPFFNKSRTISTSQCTNYSHASSHDEYTTTSSSCNNGVAVLERQERNFHPHQQQQQQNHHGNNNNNHHHDVIADAFNRYTPSMLHDVIAETYNNPHTPPIVVLEHDNELFGTLTVALPAETAPVSRHHDTSQRQEQPQQHDDVAVEQQQQQQQQEIKKLNHDVAVNNEKEATSGALIETTATTTTAAEIDKESSPSRVQRRRLDIQSDKPLYVLPPKTESMSRLETEFREMLATFSNYSMRDLYALHDPRMRTLVHGVAASGNDQAVYRAFEILFQDLMPLRVAGRMVYKRLLAFIDKSIRERDEHIAHVVEATGLDPRDVEEARIVFFEVASKLNQEAHLTPEQLTATRMFHSVHGQLNFESPTALINRLDRNGNRKIGLEDFLIGLHECAEDQCQLDENECFALDVVHNILEEIDSLENPIEFETKTSKVIAREAKELKHVMRFDEMVEIFRGWKEQVPGLWSKDKTGRKWEIVQGCFVGAENQQVVDALRVVYLEYSPLRAVAEVILSTAASLLKVKAEVKR